MAPPVPTSEQIKNAIKVASTPEAAAYLVSAFEALLQKYPALRETSDALLRELRNMAVYTEARGRQPDSEAWKAEGIPSRFDRLQDGIQSKALETIKNLPQGALILLAYAINPDTHQMRMGFSGNQQLPQEVVEALNALLVSLLGDEDILVDDNSALIQGDNGKPVKDAHGHDKKADLKKVQDVIKGLFVALMSEKGYPVEATQKPYPQTAVKAEKAAAPAEAAPESGKAEKAAPEVKGSEATKPVSGG